MSYWIDIRRTLIMLLLAGSPFVGISQHSATIDVVGNVVSNQVAIDTVIEIKFTEDGVSCGPNMRFETVYDQILHFENKLEELGVTGYSFKEVNEDVNMMSKNNIVTLSTSVSNSSDNRKITRAAKYAFAERISHYMIYEPKQYADEDALAIEAMEDAYQKADRIRKIMGFKKMTLINTDDVTSYFKNGVKLYSEQIKIQAGAYSNLKAIGYKLKQTYRME